MPTLLHEAEDRPRWRKMLATSSLMSPLWPSKGDMGLRWLMWYFLLFSDSEALPWLFCPQLSWYLCHLPRSLSLPLWLKLYLVSHLQIHPLKYKKFTFPYTTLNSVITANWCKSVTNNYRAIVCQQDKQMLEWMTFNMRLTSCTIFIFYLSTHLSVI